MCKISVIIPIYNVEKYLDKCLKSVINQTYKNLDIILVDDGSIDNSLNIAKEYAKKDERIKIIHNEENLGTFAARNNGVKHSNGEYLMFLDPDDFLELEACEKLILLIN
ncbi:glycosyltransferase family 2 protein, partial [Campylobacter jejuni]|nr:glycosyltransferase family 2 protein [Campylobacter jejuni]